MLTINIPVYNIDARPLVLQLAEQARKLNAEVEIRVYDDGSDEKTKTLNRELGNQPGVIYAELTQNLGRSAIRNKMAADSKFDNLLFIDADSKIVSGDFLKMYLDNAKVHPVLCGGTTYLSQPPNNPEKLLRWIYGSKREAIPAERRNRKKGFIITSNNFFIEKNLFLSTRFREDIGKYGHEDTLLGYDLYKKGVVPFHIQNPVEHTGLENAEIFLKKTQTAIENLYFIAEELLKNDAVFKKQVQFLKRYKTISVFLPEIFLQKCFSVFRKKIEKNLMGEKPRLLYFDLYKLCYFATIKNRKP
jgi:glycosyltransferase involved in cell wall biosynthesis